MNYGKAIRIARSMADISQAELARRTGLDRSYLSLIEGSRRNPTVGTLQKIADALTIPFHLLTLLATEKNDTKRINEQQVLGLAKELTALLLEGPQDDDQHDRDATTNRRQSSRPRISARNRKERAA